MAIFSRKLLNEKKRDRRQDRANVIFVSNVKKGN